MANVNTTIQEIKFQAAAKKPGEGYAEIEELSFTPEAPQPDDTVSVTAILKNTGELDDVAMLLTYDANIIYDDCLRDNGPCMPLTQDGTWKVVRTFKMPDSPVFLRLAVYHYETVATIAIRVLDNEKIITITPGQLPCAHATITATPTHIIDGDKVTLTLKRSPPGDDTVNLIEKISGDKYTRGTCQTTKTNTTCNIATYPAGPGQHTYYAHFQTGGCDSSDITINVEENPNKCGSFDVPCQVKDALGISTTGIYITIGLALLFIVILVYVATRR